MKNILVFMVLVISIIGISNAQTGATDIDQGLQVNGYLAVDSTITGTKYSGILTLNSKVIGTESAFVNYLEGAHILVLARQTHDSVNSLVYLQVGQNIASGTEGTDYGSIFIDTLQSANATRKVEVINIDLAPYLNYKEARIKVTAFTGVGVSAIAAQIPKWSAIIGAQGKLGKITVKGKAPTIN
jgi:hypothetical protein